MIIAFSLQADLLVSLAPIDVLLGFIADARAFKAGAMVINETSNPVFLIFVAGADFFKAPPGNIIVIAKALNAALMLIVFALFASRRVSVFAGITIALMLTGWAVNPFTPTEYFTAGYVFVLSFGLLISPVPSASLTSVVEGLIAGILLFILIAAGLPFAALGLMVLTLSGFIGGHHRGLRYLITLAALGGGTLCCIIILPEFNPFIRFEGSMNWAGMVVPVHSWFVMLSIISLLICFHANAPFYTMLYNRPSIKSVMSCMTVMLTVVGISSIQLKSVIHDLNGQNTAMMLVENGTGHANTNVQHYMNLGIISHFSGEKSEADIFLGFWEMLIRVEDFAEAEISILTKNDLACVLVPRRPCHGSGLEAARLADIVLVPRSVINQNADALLERSQGLLYSEFVRVEKPGEQFAGNWDIWRRRD